MYAIYVLDYANYDANVSDIYIYDTFTDCMEAIDPITKKTQKDKKLLGTDGIYCAMNDTAADIYRIIKKETKGYIYNSMKTDKNLLYSIRIKEVNNNGIKWIVKNTSLFDKLMKELIDKVEVIN